MAEDAETGATSAEEREVARLADGVRARDRASLAGALNLVEDRRSVGQISAVALVRALRARGPAGRGERIGVTGPPGVGKSTLLSVLARALRARGDTVGILAVDPSSVRSGGALLGDRTRIAPDARDEGLFVRSLASAGELGGLAPSVPMAVLVLSAAFDVTIVETVGVGQSETDVRNVVDTLAFVVQPGSGDALQYMKAGVMEVPDLLVVNKADLAEADRTRLELRGAVASLTAAGLSEREIPIVTTAPLDGRGIAELSAALDAHARTLASNGQRDARRRAGAVAWARRAFLQRYGERGVARVGGAAVLSRKLTEGIDEGKEVLAIVADLGDGWA